jgi:hypothetical protein
LKFLTIYWSGRFHKFEQIIVDDLNHFSFEKPAKREVSVRALFGKLGSWAGPSFFGPMGLLDLATF